MHFSLVDIDYFLAVVRHGHFGRAAAECGVTQPAITKALRRLEDATGVTLFERGAHGARLTGDGRVFHEHARRLSLHHDELVKVSTDLRAHHSGLLRVGLTNPAGDSDSVRVLAEMVRRRPGLRIRLVIGKSDALNAAVEAADLDVAVVPCPPGTTFSCEQVDLSQDTMLVAARLGHPLFKEAEPTLASTLPYSWVMPSRDSAARKAVIRMHEAAGLPEPSVAVEAEYISEAALGIVANSDVLALAPSISLRAWSGRIGPVPVRELALTRRLLLLTRRDAHHSALMQEFRDLMQQASQARH
ncbi:LysR family transcriptional regulator [Bordetella sp. 2513F-2]